MKQIELHTFLSVPVIGRCMFLIAFKNRGGWRIFIFPTNSIYTRKLTGQNSKDTFQQQKGKNSLATNKDLSLNKIREANINLVKIIK